MRKLEILFILSLALGGYRAILTPNFVFLFQTFLLFLLIFFKIKEKQFTKTVRPFELLIFLFFITYFGLRSIIDLVNESINVQNLFDVLKPIIVIMCISLSFFSFKLVDDFCNQAPGRHLSHWVVISGMISTFFILFLHLQAFRLGRLGDGLYFSTLYIFSSLLLIANLLQNKTLSSFRRDTGALFLLTSRLLVDLRRTPVVLVTGFILCFLVLQMFREVFRLNKTKSTSRLQKVLRFFLLLPFVLIVYWVVNSDIFNRLNWQAIKFALFDVRVLDIEIAYEKVMSVNPIFGLGPIFSLDLHHSAQVHSLPAGIFVSFGWVGVFLFLLLFVRLLVDAVLCSTSWRVASQNKLLFLIATIFYMLFFTFSARGFEIESFSIFAFGLAVGMKKI